MLTRYGRLIASGGTDNTVRIWDARSGIKVVGDLQGHTNYVVSVVFRPDGTQLISGSYDKTLRLWNVKSGRLIRETTTGGRVNFAAFSPDASRIVALSDGRLCLESRHGSQFDQVSITAQRT